MGNDLISSLQTHMDDDGESTCEIWGQFTKEHQQLDILMEDMYRDAFIYFMGACFSDVAVSFIGMLFCLGWLYERLLPSVCGTMLMTVGLMSMVVKVYRLATITEDCMSPVATRNGIVSLTLRLTAKTGQRESYHNAHARFLAYLQAN